MNINKFRQREGMGSKHVAKNTKRPLIQPKNLQLRRKSRPGCLYTQPIPISCSTRDRITRTSPEATACRVSFQIASDTTISTQQDCSHPLVNFVFFGEPAQSLQLPASREACCKSYMKSRIQLSIPPHLQELQAARPQEKSRCSVLPAPLKLQPSTEKFLFIFCCSSLCC